MITFREISRGDAELIFDWRRNPRVDSMMRTSMDLDFSRHVAWLDSCYTRPDYYHWIFQVNGQDAGLVSVNQFRADRQSTSWGFYVGDDSQLGAGSTVPAHIYNWLFGRLGFENVAAEVLEKNVAILRMHGIYGFTRTPESDCVIERDATRENLVSMRLAKETWQSQTRFASFKASFPIEAWVAAPDFVVP